MALPFFFLQMSVWLTDAGIGDSRTAAPKTGVSAECTRGIVDGNQRQSAPENIVFSHTLFSPWALGFLRNARSGVGLDPLR